MDSPTPATFHNASYISLYDIPFVRIEDLQSWILQEVEAASRLVAFFALPKDEGLQEMPLTAPEKPLLPNDANRPDTQQTFTLYAILANDAESTLAVMASKACVSYPSLTVQHSAAHLFEREIYEQYNLLPQGHPWLKPVRFNMPDGPAVGEMDFFVVHGDDVHEVAVGPIHAGVIECGHFRFQCLGETVMHLELSLGYHHRGVEQALVNGPHPNTLHLFEATSGDSSIAHTWAYCAVVEALAKIAVPARATALRSIALELERLACHTGDLGALAGDIGYLPTASFCGRLRGDWLNMTALLCGNRFGRNLLSPGGVRYECTQETANTLLNRIAAAGQDTHEAVDLLWRANSVLSRMTNIGTLSTKDAQELNLLGPAGRASGLTRDSRRSHPLPGTNPADVIVQQCNTGDVLARAKIRQMEIHDSVSFLTRQLKSLPETSSREHQEDMPPPLAANSLAVALVEGWRGEVCHIALTNAQGNFTKYKIIDPSFHNWQGLLHALRGQQIADFPLCNKSFNLSYCGHDL